MRVLILGVDGYLGWPTAMALSDQYEIYGVDNYLRRNLSREQDAEPLFATPNLHERVRLWEDVSGRKITVSIGDLEDWEFIAWVFQVFQPDAIIHYAEQPSAPYSMLNRKAAMLTLTNNLMVTANVIHATINFSPDAHIVKLGTMGEYGTPNIDIEEGWLEVSHKGRSQTFVYPRQAGSLYHTTKIMDTDLLWFYVRMWGLRVTDLMQGPVYGLLTEENMGNDLLMPFFSYDELFGTVLNRFVTQAVAGYPLTVYGKGGQTRGFLNIRDTLQCVRLAVQNPPQKGKMNIFNQFTETFTVCELAERVKRVGDRMGLNVMIDTIENPRIEEEEHYYNPKHTGLLELGLQPNYLSDDVLFEMMKIVYEYRHNIKVDRFFRNVRWK